MLKALEGYVNSLVIMSIIASLLMTLAPKGSTKTVIGLIAGLAVVITLLKPLATLKDINLDEFISQISSDYTSNYDNFTVNTDNLLKKLIADKTSAYILAKAQALGVECQVTVYVKNGETLAPEAVVVSGKVAPDGESQSELSRFLTLECGIPVENQRFVWE